MRVMQVMAGAERGGAETAFVDMCLALKGAGLDQLVVTRENDLRVPQLKEAGIGVECLPFGGLIDLYTPFRMRQIAKAYAPDIVQTWMSRAAWKTPKGPYKVVSRLGGYYNLKYYKTTDYFTTITPDIRDYLLSNGVPPNNVRHINNFAETEIISEPVTRPGLGTPERSIVLLALGRLHPSKALDVLIHSIREIPEAYVWIAGEGELRGELEKLARDIGVSERVKFLGWRSDRAALLQEADICVFPSRYEPFGTVFVQAWANKIPVICSMADGPRQYIRNGEDGLLFEIDNVAQLKEAIQTMIANASVRQRMIDAGYLRYQNEFTKEKTVQAYLDLYRELLRV